MATDDEFEPKLGRMRAQPTKTPRSHRSRILHAVQRAGGFKRLGKGAAKGHGSFTRGTGVGRVLNGLPARGASLRRVVVKTRFIRLAGKGAQAAVAHLKYLQRDGVTRDGQRGVLYGPDADRIEASDFMNRCEGDRHQFRFIVAPEDGNQYEDLKPLTRKIMLQMEADLETKLDWAAVDHFNTGHPHTHIVLRGRDDKGKDLVIAREYLSGGLRERVQAQVTLDLGPRSEREIIQALQAEVGQDRLTSIDCQLRRDANDQGYVLAGHRDSVVSAARAGRLVKLETLGLAERARDASWRLKPEMETTLREMGESGDIIKSIHKALKANGLEAGLSDTIVHAATKPLVQTLTGRIIERGLADEMADRHYLLLEGTDGRNHYVDIGLADRTEALPDGAIVRLTPRVPEVRVVDRTIAEVAAANGGVYTIDLHLKHDPSARQAFAETHARRLEAIRRAGGGVDREPDGRYRVPTDYLEKALAYERRDANRAPVTVDILSERSLKGQTRYVGVTWLDRELTGGRGEGFATGGFGGEARTALQARQLWLIEEGMMASPGEGPADVQKDVISRLHQWELRAVADGLAQSNGKAWRQVRAGDQVEGNLRQSVTLGSGKFAVVERAKDFALVPWRPVLEKHIGKEISGVVRESGINWSIGRVPGRDLD